MRGDFAHSPDALLRTVTTARARAQSSQTQTIGAATVPFSDAQVARDALRAR